MFVRSPSLPTPWLDRIGAVANVACVVHCGIIALAPALLPLVGLGFLHDERIEWFLLFTAVGFAATAAWTGPRAHRIGWVTVGFGVGVFGLVAARFAEVFGFEGGIVLGSVGGCILVVSHLLNLRLCRACTEGTCS